MAGAGLGRKHGRRSTVRALCSDQSGTTTVYRSACHTHASISACLLNLNPFLLSFISEFSLPSAFSSRMRQNTGRRERTVLSCPRPVQFTCSFAARAFSGSPSRTFSSSLLGVEEGVVLEFLECFSSMIRFNHCQTKLFKRQNNQKFGDAPVNILHLIRHPYCTSPSPRHRCAAALQMHSPLAPKVCLRNRCLSQHFC